MSPVVVAAARTPIGTAGHALAGVSATDLAAVVLRDLASRAEAAQPVDVVLGNCMGPGGNLARVAALTAGLSESLPGLTVDRQCASGLAAIEIAASRVRAGDPLLLAGGVESASTAPWRMWPPVDEQEPVRYRRAPFAPPESDLDMGLANDLLAHEAGVGRTRQDEYAARSHERARAAQRAGHFDAELVPVPGVLDHDERPRDGLSVTRLARLRPAFRPEGTITAGNSCGISDGAAVVAVASPEQHRRLGCPGLRIIGSATVGVAPSRPGRALVPAVRRALTEAGLSLAQMSVIEFNEAFAGQVLACCDELTLDPARVCLDGGALALGHPWGASGAVLMVRLFTQLVHHQRGRYGLAAIAAGGGLGVALVVEVAPGARASEVGQC